MAYEFCRDPQGGYYEILWISWTTGESLLKPANDRSRMQKKHVHKECKKHVPQKHATAAPHTAVLPENSSLIGHRHKEMFQWFNNSEHAAWTCHTWELQRSSSVGRKTAPSTNTSTVLQKNCKWTLKRISDLPCLENPFIYSCKCAPQNAGLIHLWVLNNTPTPELRRGQEGLTKAKVGHE